MKAGQRKGGIAWALVVALAWGAAAHAATWYVSPAGSDATGNGSTNLPYASITNAVAHAGSGDRVQVAGGVYTQNVTLATANVSVEGGYTTSWTWDPANQTSVIFGSGNSPITITAAVTNTLSYLTLRGGTNASRGGVVLNATNCGAVIEGCVITGNTYGVYIGYRVQGATLRMRNTLIARNSSYGVYAYNYDRNGGNCWLYNCTIADNGNHGYYCYTASAAGMQCAWLTNTLVTGNGGFGVYYYCVSTLNEWGQTSAAGNSLFYGNARGPWYSKIVDGGGNKCAQDPQYVDAPHGDYRLQPSSPASASGANLSTAGVTNDLLGVARPGPNGWDMGAYQGSGTGAPPAVGVGYVSRLGSDGADGSSATPWQTIGYALGRLSTTGTLYVASGTYTANLWMGEGTMTVRGGYDPSDWSWDPANQHTTINGGVTNPPITALSSRSTNTLSCLTLCGGTMTANDGAAGLRLCAATNGCFVIVDGCTITGNTYGVHNRSRGAVLTVRNTLIARNSSHGIYANLPRPGGGSCRLLNCTVANNGGHGYYSPGQSSGFDLGPMSAAITNTLFTGNNGYAVSMPYGIRLYPGYSLFFANTMGPWDGLVTDGGHNNLWMDPAYVDAANDDYRLQNGSPAAAAGANLSALGVTNDILTVVRPGANGWDLGAYQGSGTALARVAVGYVTKAGSNTGAGTPANPWATIAYGVGRLNPTGTLYVASGTYDESIWLGDSAMTIRGGYHPVTWVWAPEAERTTLDGHSNSPVAVYSTAGTNTVSGLTLRGASGGGIAVNAPSPCTVIADGCTITGNTYGVTQISDYCVQVVLRNCLIAHNSSNGIHAAENYHDLGGSGYIRLYNCTVANNGAHGCYVTANSQYRSALPLLVTNTLITGNARYGIYIEAGGVGGTAAAYSLFYGNALGAWIATNSFTHTNLTFNDAGNNTTNLDPLYTDEAASDYTITSTSSPAYNSGMDLTSQGVTYDIAGTKRPKFGFFDRGAYELPPKVGTVVVIQ